VNSAQSNNLFRGWWVLFGLFLVYAASNGILMHTLPLIYPELMDEFGWTRAQVTLPATVFFIVGAITSPPAGFLLDRYSPRLIILAGAIGMVVGLALYSGFSSLWQLVFIYALFGVSLSLGGLVSNMLILSRWFVRFRGRATGILLMASSLGGVVFPLILGKGIENFGWRPTLLLFSAIASAMMLIPLIFLIRNQPQDLKVAVDGVSNVAKASDADAAELKTSSSPVGVTLRQALKQRNFYLMAIATAAVWFSIISMVQHQSIYLAKDVGIDRTFLPVLFSTFFAASVVGKFSFGLLSDYFRKDHVLAASIAVLIAGLILLRLADASQTLSLYSYAVIAGIGFSGAFTSIQLLIAHYYAGASYGKILAGLVLFDTLAGALGTRVTAMIRDEMGSYFPAIYLLITVCIVAIAAIFMLRDPPGKMPQNTT
jgi:OFA family oxalate/formate antiporter-like MFS transporter